MLSYIASLYINETVRCTYVFFIFQLHFHGENVHELSNHVHRDILPEELGGNAGPVQNADVFKVLCEQEDYFKGKVHHLLVLFL